MRTLGKIALSIALLIGGGVVLWNLNYPNYSYRYRLTLAIEVDGKVHTGSSVIEITWHGGPEIGDVGSYHPGIRGQAALVDLGSRGAVVASLLNSDYGRAADGTYSAIWIAGRAFGNQSTNKELPQLPRLSGRRQLSADNMPLLIWFSDLSDPKTAQRLFPSDIPKLFGRTARLVEAAIEITKAPIVINIDKKLPWYQDMRSKQTGRGIISRPGEFELSYPMFISE